MIFLPNSRMRDKGTGCVSTSETWGALTAITGMVGVVPPALLRETHVPVFEKGE